PHRLPDEPLRLRSGRLPFLRLRADRRPADPRALRGGDDPRALLLALHAGDRVTDAAELLARTPLLVRRGPYVLASWMAAQISAVCQGLLRCRTSHGAVVLDELEASALLPEHALLEMPPPRNVQRNFALITLGQPMPWNVTGVLAAVAAA